MFADYSLGGFLATTLGAITHNSSRSINGPWGNRFYFTPGSDTHAGVNILQQGDLVGRLGSHCGHVMVVENIGLENQADL